ncbi:hypothetical protein ZWY2020_057532, partial [Hordeum vulgare]
AARWPNPFSSLHHELCCPPSKRDYLIFFLPELTTEMWPKLQEEETRQQSLKLPDFTCKPTDVELVQDYLRPAIRCMQPGGTHHFHGFVAWTVAVNTDLLPWTRIIADNNKGGWDDETSTTTDHTTEAYFFSFRGVRTTKWCFMKTHTRQSDHGEHNGHGLGSLCHVFQTDSASNYDDSQCLECHQQACSDQTQDSLSECFRGHRPLAIYGRARRPPPIGGENFEAMPPTKHMGASHNFHAGNLVQQEATLQRLTMAVQKRKISQMSGITSPRYLRDINGKIVTYAACNHCCKILSASSKNGTSQLARHACPCKFKPVAGRSAKDSYRPKFMIWSFL